MASVKEIRDRMKSINDTMKITNAMYLIASSKMKKARKQLLQVGPYFEKIQSTIYDILEHTIVTKEVSMYFNKRERIKEKKRCYLVITADKGLAGAYNHNIIKVVEPYIGEAKNDLFLVVGQLGRQEFTRRKISIDHDFLYAAQDPTMHRAREISSKLLKLFEDKVVDEVYIVYTKMLSSVKLEPEIFKILPLEKSNFKNEINEEGKYKKMATYVPSSWAVLDRLVPNYVNGIVFGALVESFSSEQSARMMAMDAATKSAKEMVKELTLLYNRARQAAITQELSEIVGGAEALKN